LTSGATENMFGRSNNAKPNTNKNK